MGLSSSNKYAPILEDGPVERYTQEQNILVRLRLRFRVIVGGAVFGTLDVPINSDGYSYGYLWNHTTVPSNRYSPLPVMDGGFGIELYTGTTSTTANLIAQDNDGAVIIRDQTNGVAANRVDGYCTSNLGNTNFLQNVFNGDEDFDDFNEQIHTDTTEQEKDYINWQMDD